MVTDFVPLFNCMSMSQFSVDLCELHQHGYEGG